MDDLEGGHHLSLEHGEINERHTCFKSILGCYRGDRKAKEHLVDFTSLNQGGSRLRADVLPPTGVSHADD